MCTVTLVVAEALPAQPLTVSLLSTVDRSAMARAYELVNGPQVVGAGAGAGAAAPTYSSLFGEPVLALVTLSAVAVPTSVSRTCCGVIVGFCASSSAASPATCGVALEVPLMVVVAVSPVL